LAEHNVGSRGQEDYLDAPHDLPPERIPPEELVVRGDDAVADLVDTALARIVVGKPYPLGPEACMALQVEKEFGEIEDVEGLATPWSEHDDAEYGERTKDDLCP
jgi:hypothetical protein